jgi:hypothetical protein
MFAPELAQRNVPSPTTLLALQLILFLCGALLSFKAYGRETGRDTLDPP